MASKKKEKRVGVGGKGERRERSGRKLHYKKNRLGLIKRRSGIGY